MKQFFKNVAATIVGIFGFGIIMVILAFITLIGMMCNSSKTPSLKDNSVMVMKLQGQISDQANDDWLTAHRQPIQQPWHEQYPLSHQEGKTGG